MPDWVMQAAAQAGILLVTGGALYGGIRADLRAVVESAARAHRRIDEHLGDHLRGQLSRGLGG